jgi:hypothetical protein
LSLISSRQTPRGHKEKEMPLLTLRRIVPAFVVAVLISVPAIAQKYTAPSDPQIGSGNTVTADPKVPRPAGQPCTVQLFSNFDFADFSPKFFSYTPGCAGPWSKVVLNADWSVDAGRQFDRTAEIWIGGTNVYFGTTAEPSRTVERSWHTEVDLTEYTPLLTIAQGGRVDLGNLVNNTYTSHLHGSAYIQFYPVGAHQQPPAVADIVLPMAADATGGTVTLNTGSDQLAKTFNLPTNVERAYLDVFAQSQSNDEFWYTCAPNDVAAELQDCGNTAFREAEVSIDGQAAGIAPVYPWIYTGGIDPYLWRPVPGIQTLNFQPYRVDLTPFASILSNGTQHTVAVNVYNADQYFSATATLLLYLDHGSQQVTGALLKDTLGQPDPTVKENIQTNGTAYYGNVSVSSNRGFIVSGYTNTSHGKVQTDVAQTITFSNAQTYNVYIDGSVYDQTVKQLTSIVSQTSTKSGGTLLLDSRLNAWPMTLNFAYNAYQDGSQKQVTSITQGLSDNRLTTQNGWPIYFSLLNVAENPGDTLLIDPNGVVTTQNQANNEVYTYLDSNGACWDRTVKANGGTLTSYKDGCGKK